MTTPMKRLLYQLHNFISLRPNQGCPLAMSINFWLLRFSSVISLIRNESKVSYACSLQGKETSQGLTWLNFYVGRQPLIQFQAKLSDSKSTQIKLNQVGSSLCSKAYKVAYLTRAFATIITTTSVLIEVLCIPPPPPPS